MRRKTRLFALAEALRARRTGVTAAQLADRFGVTLRTIYRDLDALQDAGMPIKADRGRGGGYALDKSYQLPPVNFTAREAALLLALASCNLALGIEGTTLEPDAPAPDAPDGPPPPDAPPPSIDVGTGADGPVLVTAGEILTINTVRAGVTSSLPSGSPAINVSTIDGFVAGGEVLIIQMAGAAAGQHETARIASANALSRPGRLARVGTAT